MACFTVSLSADLMPAYSIIIFYIIIIYIYIKGLKIKSAVLLIGYEKDQVLGMRRPWHPKLLLLHAALVKF